MSRALGCGVTVCHFPAFSAQRHISGARTGLGIVAVAAKGVGGAMPRGRSEGPYGAAADCTSPGMDAGVGEEMCSCAEAKLNTDFGSAVAQTLHATVVGVLLSQRKTLGSLTNIPEAAGQENEPTSSTFHLGSRVVGLSVRQGRSCMLWLGLTVLLDVRGPR